MSKPPAPVPPTASASANAAVLSSATKSDLATSQAGANDDLVALAKIGRPYGLTGAMHVFPYSPDAATLRRAKRVTVRNRECVVKSLRAHGEAYVMTLEGVDAPEVAQTFTNADVYVTRDVFPPLAKGEYYWVDLVGLNCVNGERLFGQVVEIFEVGAHPILRVRRSPEANERDDELIPFVDAIIRSVDIEARRIDVDWHGMHDE